MKFETIETTSAGEVRKAIAAVIAKKGANNAAATEIGVPPSMISQIMGGHMNPSRKVLDYFGLQARTVYERKEADTQ